VAGDVKLDIIGVIIQRVAQILLIDVFCEFKKPIE